VDRRLTEGIEGSEGNTSEHSGSDEGNDEIRQPVCRDCNADSLAADALWEHLTWHDPIDASDREGEVGNIRSR
jgi:hypothetical protein